MWSFLPTIELSFGLDQCFLGQNYAAAFCLQRTFIKSTFGSSAVHGVKRICIEQKNWRQNNFKAEREIAFSKAFSTQQQSIGTEVMQCKLLRRPSCILGDPKILVKTVLDKLFYKSNHLYFYLALWQFSKRMATTQKFVIKLKRLSANSLLLPLLLLEVVGSLLIENLESKWWHTYGLKTHVFRCWGIVLRKLCRLAPILDPHNRLGWLLFMLNARDFFCRNDE